MLYSNELPLAPESSAITTGSLVALMTPGGPLHWMRHLDFALILPGEVLDDVWAWAQQEYRQREKN